MGWIDFEHEARTYRLAVAKTPGGVWVGWSGRTAFIPRRERTAGAEERSGAEVRAPLPGRIVEVHVAPGDVVEEGALMVVLEAMKMEYRLAAPMAAIVETVHCTAGELVDLGRTLVTQRP